MTTVAHEDHLTVEVLYRDEHPPPHVHITSSRGWEIRVKIGKVIKHWDTLVGSPAVSEISEAMDLVLEVHDQACAEWNKMAKANEHKWGYSAEAEHG